MIGWADRNSDHAAAKAICADVDDTMNEVNSPAELSEAAWMTSHDQNKPVDDSLAKLVCVDPKRVAEILPHVAALLKAACQRTKLSAFEDIAADILSGRSLLWLAWDGDAVQSAAATVLINSDIGKVCIITACGGSGMKQWLPLIDQIEAYARREGCTNVRIYGRKGWLRVLEGYRQAHVIIDKQLH